jgi:hypothetical protein
MQSAARDARHTTTTQYRTFLSSTILMALRKPEAPPTATQALSSTLVTKFA